MTQFLFQFHVHIHPRAYPNGMDMCRSNSSVLGWGKETDFLLSSMIDTTNIAHCIISILQEFTLKFCAKLSLYTFNYWEGVLCCPGGRVGEQICVECILFDAWCKGGNDEVHCPLQGCTIWALIVRNSRTTLCSSKKGALEM